ncbi:MlaE family ABC transporter permease [Bdellovibrio svalbardensis]|uniref:ABC transporter permease n=1 Tax=Bdellovibrio svalbardensis TaxID=2972972 RepID=A0ABT6DDW2_9BACT|nr:ABC transporter permease [Bdellovibrio svalbardensis]MDG0815025.1 ABC transporter permease [Bdellovibrio svalbardensis]
MSYFITVLDELGGTLLFFNKIISTLFKKAPKSHDVFEQIWKVTADSFLTTAMAGFFVGAIMSVQFAMLMKEFGALGYLGGLATSATFREVGPLLIAFMLSGKVGAFTSAELGTMRVTEQIDAVRCLGADPMQEIIAPRFIGIIIASFFLLGAGLIMSVFGGMLLGDLFGGVNFEEYLRHIPTIVSPISILSGLVKCFAFAVVLATVCTFKGYSTTGGAKGVGRAVVSTAVTTMICIVVMDWFTSFLGEIFLQIIRGYRS